MSHIATDPLYVLHILMASFYGPWLWEITQWPRLLGLLTSVPDVSYSHWSSLCTTYIGGITLWCLTVGDNPVPQAAGSINFCSLLSEWFPEYNRSSNKTICSRKKAANYSLSKLQEFYRIRLPYAPLGHWSSLCTTYIGGITLWSLTVGDNPVTQAAGSINFCPWCPIKPLILSMYYIYWWHNCMVSMGDDPVTQAAGSINFCPRCPN